jgi:hypothetical protein
MFNVTIDSKLRGCDVVSLNVEDIALHGAALDRATVRQSKTEHQVRFKLTERTREAIDAYIRANAYGRETSSLQAGVFRVEASPHHNMHGLCPSGSQVLARMPISMALIS